MTTLHGSCMSTFCIPTAVNEEFIAFNKAIDEEVIRARAQLKLDMIRLRKELDEQEKREIAAAKQRYLDELAAKKEQGNGPYFLSWRQKNCLLLVSS